MLFQALHQLQIFVSALYIVNCSTDTWRIYNLKSKWKRFLMKSKGCRDVCLVMKKSTTGPQCIQTRPCISTSVAAVWLIQNLVNVVACNVFLQIVSYFLEQCWLAGYINSEPHLFTMSLIYTTTNVHPVCILLASQIVLPFCVTP